MTKVLLSAASGFVLAVCVGQASAAQCTQTPNGGGTLLECGPGAYTDIIFAIDDLTVVVGDSAAVSNTTTVTRSDGYGAVVLSSDNGVFDLDFYNTYINVTNANPFVTGVQITAGANSTGLDVSLTNVTFVGDSGGVRMINPGTGDTNIVISGGSFTAVGNDTIAVAHTGASGNVSVTNDANLTNTSSEVFTQPLSVSNQGSGTVYVNNSGDLTSSASTALIVSSYGHQTIVNTGNLDGGNAGISSVMNGDGSVSVTSSVSISGGNFGFNFYGGSPSCTTCDGSVNVHILGNVYGGQYGGVNVFDGGSRDISISVQNISTQTGAGLSAYITSGNIDVNAADVYSGIGEAANLVQVGTSTGIRVNFTGTVTGDTLLDVENVQATGFEYGIFVNSSGGLIDINASGDVAGIIGVRALHNGGGDLNIATYADVESNFANQAVSGIYARHSGGGNVTITNTGTVDGGIGNGIIARMLGGSGDMSVTVNEVTTSGTFVQGMSINNLGSGDTYVSALNVTGDAGLTATAVAGDVIIRSTGTLTGNAFQGVSGSSTTGNVDIEVNNAHSLGNGGGVTAGINGPGNTGNINVLVTGNVSGFGGVSTSHAGSGTVNIETQGTVNTSSNFPFSYAVGGIFSGGADVDITTIGDVYSQYGQGIHIRRSTDNGEGGFTRIVTGNADSGNGYNTAIRITHYSGAGALDSDGIDITTTGTNVGSIILDIEDVTNTSSAIASAIDIDSGTALIDIEVNGDVIGSRFGIVTRSSGSVDILNRNGSSITGSTAAIRSNDLSGPSSTVVRNYGLITGDVILGNGDDQFVNYSTGMIDPSSVINMGRDNDTFSLLSGLTFTSSVLAGTGVDTLRLQGISDTLIDTNRTGNQFRQFENMEVRSDGWTLGGVHFNYDDISFFNGTNTNIAPGARLFTDAAHIRPGATIDMGNGSIFSRTVFQNDGVLEIGGDGTHASASIIGIFNMGAGGVLNIDAPAAGDNDLLRVIGSNASGWGTANLGGTFNLDQAYALTQGQYTVINALNNLNGTFATVNGLGSGAMLEQELVYVASNNTVRVVTSPIMMTPETGGSKSVASAANYIVSGIGDSGDYAKLGFAVGTLDSFAQIGDFASGVTPDVLDSAVMVSDGAALRFGNTLAGCEMNFSLNAAESCVAVDGQHGPAMFGEIRQTSANTGTEVGHNFNAQSFDMTFGVRLTDADDVTQFGLMSGYSKSGSVSDAYASTPALRGFALSGSAPQDEGGGVTPNPLIPAQAGTQAELADGLEAETFSFGGYARRDSMLLGGWWSLDGTAMVSTSEAKLVRNITPGLGIAEQAQSEFVSRQFNLQGTATLNGLNSSEFAIKPLATLGNRTLQRDGFTETGADLLGLSVDGQTRNVSYAGLGVEFAPDFTDEQGNGFRGLIRVTGLAYAGDTNSEFTARFTNAPGDDRFTYFGQNLDTSVLLEGGFKYIAGDGFAIGAEGFGEVNPETGDSSAVGATLQLIKRW